MLMETKSGILALESCRGLRGQQPFVHISWRTLRLEDVQGAEFFVDRGTQLDRRCPSRLARDKDGGGCGKPIQELI